MPSGWKYHCFTLVATLVFIWYSEGLPKKDDEYAQVN